MIPITIPERDKCDNVIFYKYLSISFDYSIKNVTIPFAEKNVCVISYTHLIRTDNNIKFREGNYKSVLFSLYKINVFF